MIVSEAEALAALAAGEVVAIPTDTVYGLAVDPSLASSAGRLFAVKGRPEQLALPVLVADSITAERLGVIDGGARRLVERYWPGPLTLVTSRRQGVTFDLGGDPTTIGLRCPAHALALVLLGASGPLAVTSANRHGARPCRSAGEVQVAFGASLPVLDGGECDGEPSTVVSLVSGSVACLREGAIGMNEIERAWRDGASAGA
ncbi:MAG TPA: L-threonylcarbamoyladenylate synthase [Acidimicrobiales bacterium]|nr:L-threonylcarbamoyladenylate synthase [Acidimicrobiales bacterium]